MIALSWIVGAVALLVVVAFAIKRVMLWLLDIVSGWFFGAI